MSTWANAAPKGILKEFATLAAEISFRVLAALSAIVILLGCAACTSSTSQGTAPTIATTNLSVGPTSSGQAVPGCSTGGGAQAWAQDVSPVGRVLWQTALTSTQSDSGIPIQPVTVAGAGIFVAGTDVYGVRLSDGKKLWTAVTGQGVNNLWAGPSAVTVLAGQASDQPVIFSLDAHSGKERWRIRLTHDALSNNQAVTSDGELATITAQGTLVVRSLVTGRTLWSVTGMATYPGGPAAQGDIIVAGSGVSQVRGYADRTGAVLWTDSGMPAKPAFNVTGSVILVDSLYGGPGTPTGIAALSAATGHVEWHLDPHSLSSLVASGPAGIALQMTTTHSLDLIDAHSGRITWRAPAYSGVPDGTIVFPLITATDVTYVMPTSPSTGRIVDLAAATGRISWQGPVLSAQTSAPVALPGGMALLSAWTSQDSYLSAFSLVSGASAWRVALPAPAQATPLVTTSGVLVEPIVPFSVCPQQ
jgi:PQQ-like domain